MNFRMFAKKTMTDFVVYVNIEYVNVDLIYWN